MISENKINHSSCDKNKGFASFHYRISKNDYVESIQLARKLTLKRTFLYTLWLVVLSLMSWHLSNGSLLSALIAPTIGIFYLVLAHQIIAPWVAGRDYSKHKTMHVSMSVEIVKDGVSLERRGGSAILYWDELLKWQENDKYILLYTMPRIFHIIPKRIGKVGFNLDHLLDCLKQRIHYG